MNKARKLVLILPLKGSSHGAKIIFREIFQSLKNKFYLVVIDTAQADSSQDYGKFRFSKLLNSLEILVTVCKRLKRRENVYLNFTPHGFAFFRDLGILLLLKLKSSNVTIHLHANELEKQYNLITKWILKDVKTIVINSNQRSKITHSNKLFLLPNSLPDFKKYSFDEILKVRKSNRLLFISNLSQQKGFYRLLRIGGELIKHFPNLEIHIYGNILNKEVENTIEALPKDSNFFYMGVVSNLTEKSIIYSEATALLFLSDENYEVFPLVYLEALMHGLPIITTHQHVSEIVINKNGIILDENPEIDKVKSFVQEISTSRESLNYCSQQSYNLYTNFFSFASYIDKLEKIILLK